MGNCIFCRIIKGEIPAERIYEDETVLAFLDINPVNYGHALVIPKDHFETMEDVPENILSKVFSKSKNLMKRIKEAMKSDFVALAVVGLDVPHFHVHLVPRYFNDGMANFWPTKKYKEGEIEEIGKKIRNFL